MHPQEQKSKNTHAHTKYVSPVNPHYHLPCKSLSSRRDDWPFAAVLAAWPDATQIVILPSIESVPVPVCVETVRSAWNTFPIYPTFVGKK